ncbi:MAG: hypothetical protein QMB40_04500 [Aeromonadaceae bacterium]
MAQHPSAPRPQPLAWLLLLLGIGLLLPQLLPSVAPTSDREASLHFSARTLLRLGNDSPMLFDLQAPGCRLQSLCDERAL